MLRLTWTLPCTSFDQQRRRFDSSHISSNIISHKGLSSNQLGLLLSLNNRRNSNMHNSIVCNSVQPGASGGGSPFNSWQGWLLGVVVSLIIPFWKNKWGPLLALKNRVDMVADTVEAVAEAIEHVAEKVEDITDEIGDNIPEGTKLRDAFDLVEKIAKETAKDAHIVDEFIEKAEELEDKVESLLENKGLNKETKIIIETKTEDKSLVDEKPSI